MVYQDFTDSNNWINIIIIATRKLYVFRFESLLYYPAASLHLEFLEFYFRMHLFTSVNFKKEMRNKLINIMTNYGLDDLVYITRFGQKFSLSLHVQTGFGVG